MRTKAEKLKGYVRIYCYNFGIEDEVMEMLFELVEEPKWKNRTDKQIQRVLKSLTEFTTEYQKILIKTTLDNGYQGLIFPDSKKKQEQYFKSNLPTYEQRRKDRADITELAGEILRNRNAS